MQNQTETQPAACACLDGCHCKPEAAETQTPQSIIASLYSLITRVTRRTPDGRVEPYCGGDCGLISDLSQLADFSVVDRAAEFLCHGPEYRPTTARDQLRDRIADICCGACGRFVGDEDETIAVLELSRVMPAIQATWPGLPDWVWYLHNIKHFHTVDSITDFIFGALQG